MTEEEKNTQAEADDDLLKVVMSEADRVTMPEETYQEQPEYLKNFTNFYISEFDQHDLELMNLFDTDHNMVDINQYLINNKVLSRRSLIKHILHRHADNFLSLLAEIEKEAEVKPAEMTDYADWEKWYEKRRQQIPGSLS